MCLVHPHGIYRPWLDVYLPFADVPCAGLAQWLQLHRWPLCLFGWMVWHSRCGVHRQRGDDQMIWNIHEHSMYHFLEMSGFTSFHIPDIRGTWGNLPIWSISGWRFGTWLLFFHILGISSSQLANSIIFQRGRSTTNQICQSGLQHWPDGSTWAIWTFNPVKRRAKPSTGDINSWRFFRLTCPGRFGSHGRSEDCTFGVSLTGCGQSSPCVGLWGAQGSDGRHAKTICFQTVSFISIIIIPHYKISCYTILYHVIPYYTILYHIIPYYTILSYNDTIWPYWALATSEERKCSCWQLLLWCHSTGGSLATDLGRPDRPDRPESLSPFARRPGLQYRGPVEHLEF